MAKKRPVFRHGDSSIINHIQDIIRIRGISEDDLAIAAEVSTSTIRQICHGKRVSLDTLERVAKALGVEITTTCDAHDEPFEKEITLTSDILNMPMHEFFATALLALKKM